MTEWGEAISVDGKRPEWLTDDNQPVGVGTEESIREGVWYGAIKSNTKWRVGEFNDDWVSIRLPATHPYYLVQRYNAEHGTSFVYWPGGDAAPDDFGAGVMFRNGFVSDPDDDGPWEWRNVLGSSDIIGYTRRTEPKSETATYDPATHVAVRRMTEAEADAFATDVGQACRNPLTPLYAKDGRRDGILRALRDLGISYRPAATPTEAERIAAKTGIDLATVTAVLDAREGK